MGDIQGNSKKMENSIIKLLDGLLCSSLPEILEQEDRKKIFVNTVFSIIGDVDDNEEVILEKLKEKIQTDIKEHIIALLTNKREYYTDIVSKALIDNIKLMDEKERQKK